MLTHTLTHTQAHSTISIEHKTFNAKTKKIAFPCTVKFEISEASRRRRRRRRRSRVRRRHHTHCQP